MARMDGLKLKKVGSTIQVSMLKQQKSPKNIMGCAPWSNLFDIAFITPQELFVCELRHFNIFELSSVLHDLRQQYRSDIAFSTQLLFNKEVFCNHISQFVSCFPRKRNFLRALLKWQEGCTLWFKTCMSLVHSSGDKYFCHVSSQSLHMVSDLLLILFSFCEIVFVKSKQNRFFNWPGLF